MVRPVRAAGQRDRGQGRGRRYGRGQPPAPRDRRPAGAVLGRRQEPPAAARRRRGRRGQRGRPPGRAGLQELVRAFEGGDTATALRLHLENLELFEGLFATSSPILLKACMNLLGLPAGPLRPPLVDATPDQVEFARGLLAGVGLGGRGSEPRRSPRWIGCPYWSARDFPGGTRGDPGRVPGQAGGDRAQLRGRRGRRGPAAGRLRAGLPRRRPAGRRHHPARLRLAGRGPERVVGVVLTHAHEDHIGALPYFLRDFDVPVYGTRLSLAMLAAKLEEHQLNRPWSRSRAASGPTSARSTSSSTPCRTRSPTAWPWPCAPPAARSCTPATSRWT